MTRFEFDQVPSDCWMDWVATEYSFFLSWGLDGKAVNERYPIESCQLLAGDQTNQ